jgi:cytochrome P450
MSETAGAAIFDELFRSEHPPQDPYPRYEQLRELGPVLPVGPGLWLTTSFSLCSVALRDSRLGNDADAAGTARGGPGWRDHPALTTLAGMLLMANPPRHTRLRQLLTSHFSAHPVSSLRPAIERHVDVLMAELMDVGEADFVATFADDLPRQVIADVIGIPEADRRQFRDRTLAFNAVFERSMTPRQLAEADAAAVEIDAYVRELIHDVSRTPRPGLLSVLVTASDAGALPPSELAPVVFQLYNASYQTVLSMLGNGLWTLLGHPAEFGRLRRDPSLAASAVAEILRFESPVQTTGRHAAARCAIGPVTLEPGELLVTVLGAAHRDPDRFAHPDRFDITRRSPSSIAFGYGIHYCLGAALANLQGEVAFRAVARPGIEIEPVAPPRYRESANMRTVDSLPIRIQVVPPGRRL